MQGGREPASVCVCVCADRAPCLSVVQNKVPALYSSVAGALLPVSNTTMLQLQHFQDTLVNHL